MNHDDLSYGAPEAPTREEEDEARPDVARPIAWTLAQTLQDAKTTHGAPLWFNDPQNTAWAPLYDEAAISAEYRRGFNEAQELERQDWNRVHHALAKHGAHPGRTNDRLDDVIDGTLGTLHERIADLLQVLRMVDDNHRVDDGEKRKAWSCRFVVEEVRRVLALGPNVEVTCPPRAGHRSDDE